VGKLRVLRQYPWYAVVVLLVVAAAIGSSYGAVAHNNNAGSAGNGCGAGSTQCLALPDIALIQTTDTTATSTSSTMTSTSSTMTSTSSTFTPGAPSPGPGSTTSTTTGSTTTVPKSFPHSSVSYPNGAIVTFGSAHDVFAGGRAFETTSSQLAAVQKVDHAKVLAAPAGVTAPTSTHPRSGVLVFTRPVNGNDEIYVTGTDGELHGFATSAQLVGDGYDPRLVVTIPSLGGLTVGSNAGSTLTALATKADGAIVNSSGTFYTFAGGKAFGIGTPAMLTQVRKTNNAQTLTGSVTSSQTSAAIASGVLIDVSGSVYVSYQGAVYPFKSMTQLGNDGYGGTAAVPTPHTGGLTVVSNYTGS
jgi:hypothetical protein